jgi:hypothetical protein
MKNKSFTVILIILIICSGSPALSQEEVPPLVTDRPDQTESSVTVPFRALQFEMGGFIEMDKTDELESYGRYSTDEDPDHRMDAGITYLLTPNLQLDASAGMGISEAAPDYFVSIGCTLRIMK